MNEVNTKNQEPKERKMKIITNFYSVNGGTNNMFTCTVVDGNNSVLKRFWTKGDKNKCITRAERYVSKIQREQALEERKQTPSYIAIENAYAYVETKGFETVRAYVEHLFDEDLKGVDVGDECQKINDLLSDSSFQVGYYIYQYVCSDEGDRFINKYKNQNPRSF
jgi:hypothetical protein